MLRSLATTSIPRRQDVAACLMGAFTLLLPAVVAIGQVPAASVTALGDAPLLTFYRQGDRLLAAIDRQLLGADFLLRAQATAVARTAVEEAARIAASERVPMLGARWTS